MSYRRISLPVLIRLQLLIGLLAGALVLTGVPIADASTHEHAKEHKSGKRLDNTTRSDSVAAMVTARQTKHRVEDLSQRTETTQVFANPDGSWTESQSAGPVRVQDSAGDWQDIDTTLVEGDGGYAPRYAASDLVVSSGGGRTFASLRAHGKNLAFEWPTVLPKPVVEGSTATYANVVPNGDLVVKATATGFSHDLVLHKRPTKAIDVTVKVATDGVTLTESKTGELNFLNAKGKAVASSATPLMWDSSTSGSNEDAPLTVDVGVARTSTGTPTMTLSPDDDFLSDPATVYPVTIDPSFTTWASSDTWIQNTEPSSGHPSDEALRVGTNDGGTHLALSYLKFDGGVSKWVGKNITSAKLYLRNFDSVSCTSGQINVYRILGSWDAASLNWGNKPTLTTTDGSTFNAAYGGGASCPTNWSVFDVAAIVQTWANGATYNGLRVSADSTTSSTGYRQYRSANYSADTTLRPHLDVTYRNYPAAGQLSTSPGNPGYLTNPASTLSAVVTDADGGSVRGDFQILTTANVLVWSGSSSYVASGQTASITVPYGLLSNGTQYKIQVKGYDGALQSKSWTSVNATLDTTAPTVSFTATSPSNGEWVSSSPASNFLTIDGGSDAASFELQNLITGQYLTVPADAGGTITSAGILSQWPAAMGWNRWLVSVTDKAGNPTNTSQEFAFGVGAVSIGQPSRAQTSLGQVPVTASGKPGVATAKLQWRYNDASSTSWQDLTHVTKGGAAWDHSAPNDAGGIAALTGDLVWDASQQIDTSTSAPLKMPSLVEVRACFTYSSGEQCSPEREVQLVASGFDGDLPTTSVGPMTVALTTGEASLSGMDVVDSMAGVGRSFSSFSAATQASGGAFGPGWDSSVVATAEVDSDLVDHRDVDKSFVVVSSLGSSETFTKVDPADGANHDYLRTESDDGSRLTVDDGTATLVRPHDGPKTVWTCDDSPCADGSDWTVQAGSAPDSSIGLSTGTDASGNPIANDGYPTWVAQTDPGVSAVCTSATQASGCRGLRLTYSGTGDQKRLVSADRVIGGTTPASTTVATYTYSDMATDGGKLTKACGPGVVPLCTTYTYATVAGRTLLATATPPGQAAWTFGYDSTGRLTTVSRPLDATTNVDTGNATWTVAYGLSPSASGLPDMSSSAIAQWGQNALPASVAAVFPPSHVPSSTPTSSDLPYAQLWYSDVSGSETNEAQYGAGQWLVDTQWLDNGKVVRSLDAAGRARALAAPASQRTQTAYAGSALSTYDDDSNPLAEYGPAHVSTLTDGTVGVFRPATRYVYSSDPGDEDLVTEVRHSATLNDLSADYDVSVVDNEYDAIVSGDGDGHELGLATKVKTQTGPSTWSTQITRYDDSGRVIETRQPGGGANAAGAGNDAHSTVTSYYSVGSSDSDCDSATNKAWTGLTCKVGPAAQPAGQPIPTTWYKIYDDQLNAATVREYTSSTDYKETTQTYDDMGRPLTTTMKTYVAGSPTDTVTRTQGYSPTSGLNTTTTSGSSTIQRVFDSWGRVDRYIDLTWTSRYKYTRDGQLASLNDGLATATYGYDGTTSTGVEHRGLPTAVDADLPSGMADNFTLAYNAAGAVAQAVYPTGMVASMNYDDLGAETGLVYSSGASVLASFGAAFDVDGRSIENTSPLSDRKYAFDALGRLTATQDTSDAGCTTRSYGFDSFSDRTTSTTWAPDPTTGACATSTSTTSKTWTYDAANRITSPGYSYDKLGRTLSVPVADTAPGGTGALTLTYRANDQPASMTQAHGAYAEETDFSLDPDGRSNVHTQRVNGNAGTALTMIYADDGDSPEIVDYSGSRERYVSVPGLGNVMSHIETSDDTDSRVNITNLHGDIVGYTPNAPTPTLYGYVETDEYGQSSAAPESGYRWSGGSQLWTEYHTSGLVLMGARLYNAGTGSFLQADPVRGGNATSYAFPADPVNYSDPSGQYGRWTHYWHWNRVVVFFHFTRKETDWMYYHEWEIAAWVEGILNTAWASAAAAAGSATFGLGALMMAALTGMFETIVATRLGAFLDKVSYAHDHRQCARANFTVYYWLKTSLSFSSIRCS